MHRLFVGNIPNYVTPNALREVFNTVRVDVINVRARQGGYAFVDVPNQNAADRAIEIFKTFDPFGGFLRVEPSMPRQLHVRSNKLFIRQLPKEIEWEEFEKYLQQYGDFINCEHAGNSDSPSAVITYKTNDDAHCAMEKLNGQDYKGQGLKVSISIDRAYRNNQRRIPNRIMNGGDLGGGGGGMGAPGGRPISSEMPLRMVVNAKYVGAIIGQGGSNIRQITKDSKARCVVDVSRGLRDQFGNVEKLINVYGPPDNASKACIKIMEIVQREMQDDPANQGKILELELKIRAHNNLVGRLIGKGGGTIKRIMEETGCTIFVSNIGEISPFNMERTITIKGGTLDKMSQAEQKISSKLRQCFENDIINAPHTMYGGMHPLMSFGGGDTYTTAGPYTPVGILPHASAYATGAMTPSATAGIQSPSGAGLLPHGANSGGGGTLSAPSTPAPHHFPGGGSATASGFPHMMAGNTEVVHIWVPNNIVGALIGTKGSQIRSVMRLTGAHIRIETSSPLQNGSVGGGDHAGDRDGGAEGDGPTNNGRENDATVNGGAGNNGSDSAATPAANGQDSYSDDEKYQAGGDHNRRRSDLQADSNERRVTITGTDQQQYKNYQVLWYWPRGYPYDGQFLKAQFWIFQRICEQGYHFFDEVRLCTEIQVPSKMVGRIIGKGGQNVRELQRVTGAQVKIPDDVAHDSPEDTVVRIIGNFNATQAVQARIRQLLHLMHNRTGGS